jgi:hypothetical protein
MATEQTILGNGSSEVERLLTEESALSLVKERHKETIRQLKEKSALLVAATQGKSQGLSLGAVMVNKEGFDEPAASSGNDGARLPQIRNSTGSVKTSKTQTVGLGENVAELSEARDIIRKDRQSGMTSVKTGAASPGTNSGPNASFPDIVSGLNSCYAPETSPKTVISEKGHDRAGRTRDVIKNGHARIQA